MRCFGDGDPLYEQYHDTEWGRPRTAERDLYERICLEGFQSGLAWITVLRKREHLREAFSGFDPDRVAAYDGIEHLMSDVRLIRSRPKLRACVRNARATVGLREQGGLPAVVWAYRRDGPAPTSVPAATPGSTALARRLKAAGFAFVGPTTCYALLQACGVVDDHAEGCAARPEVERERAAVPLP